MGPIKLRRAARQENDEMVSALLASNRVEPNLAEMLEDAAEQLVASDERRKRDLSRVEKHLRLTLELLPQRRRELWDEICREVIAGHAQEVQAFRDRFRAEMERQLSILSQAKRIAEVAASIGLNAARAEEIPSATAEAERFRNNVALAWETRDDLEELVVRYHPVRGERLKRFVENHPAPQSWYDQEDMPL